MKKIDHDALNKIGHKKIWHMAKYLLLSIIVVSVHYLADYHFKISNENLIEKDEIKENVLFFIFLSVLILPVIEETAFRLPLKKNKYALLSLLILIGFLFLIESTVAKLLLLSFFVLIILNQTTKITVVSYMTITSSILSFTAIHVSNYNNEYISGVRWLELLFILLPQLLVGSMATIIRFKTNVLYSIIYHILYNSIIISFALVSGEI